MGTNITRESIAAVLKHRTNLNFKECDDRMNYGMIGTLNCKESDSIAILIYSATFYVRDIDLAITDDIVNVIKLIQEEFENQTRDEKNKVILFQDEY